MRGDTAVGVQQPVLPLAVGHPVLVEEHVLAGQAEPVGQLHGAGADVHLGDLGVGMAHAEEDQPGVGAFLDKFLERPDEGERVEPAVHAARPQHDPIGVADAERVPQT